MEKTNILLKNEDTQLTQDQQMFVERENHCPLCNTSVNIRVRSYLENFTIAEEAHCDKCDLIIRTKDHKIN